MSLSSVSLIHGLSLGLEHIDAIPEEDISTSIILDFFFLRFIFAIA